MSFPSLYRFDFNITSKCWFDRQASASISSVDRNRRWISDESCASQKQDTAGNRFSVIHGFVFIDNSNELQYISVLCIFHAYSICILYYLRVLLSSTLLDQCIC